MTGNTVVLKPSEITPLAISLLVEGARAGGASRWRRSLKPSGHGHGTYGLGYLLYVPPRGRAVISQVIGPPVVPVPPSRQSRSRSACPVAKATMSGFLPSWAINAMVFR